MLQDANGFTLLEVKYFPDLATMLRVYMGPRSARTLAELSGVDPNAIIRALRGEPMPDEAAGRLAKFFNMDSRQQQEFNVHVLRARAYGYKSARPYLAHLEKELESIDKLLLRLARAVPMSGTINEQDAEKLREIARAILQRYADPANG